MLLGMQITLIHKKRSFTDTFLWKKTMLEALSSIHARQLRFCSISYGGPQVQYKNLNIPVQKNKYQHKNIISVQKYFVSVPKYIFQSKNIYFSTKKRFPKSINISQVSLRPAAGRREVSLSKWRILMVFKKKQLLIILRNDKYETILGFLERFHDIRTSMRTRKIA